MPQCCATTIRSLKYQMGAQLMQLMQTNATINHVTKEQTHQTSLIHGCILAWEDDTGANSAYHRFLIVQVAILVDLRFVRSDTRDCSLLISLHRGKTRSIVRRCLINSYCLFSGLDQQCIIKAMKTTIFSLGQESIGPTFLTIDLNRKALETDGG